METHGPINVKNRGCYFHIAVFCLWVRKPSSMTSVVDHFSDIRDQTFYLLGRAGVTFENIIWHPICLNNCLPRVEKHVGPHFV